MGRVHRSSTRGTGASVVNKGTGASIVDQRDIAPLSPASWWEKLLCNKALKKHVQIFYDVWVM